MVEIHPDFGELYSYSDHRIGDHVSYRVEGRTVRGEILWVAAASTLPSSGQHFPPHYVVAPDRGGFPDMVLFSDICMDAEPTMEYCPFCLGMHPKGTTKQCPLYHPNA